MKNKYLLLLLVGLFMHLGVFAQVSCELGASTNDAFICHPGDCTDLTVTPYDAFETDNSYTVSSIPYSPPQAYVPQNTVYHEVPLDIDDAWDPGPAIGYDANGNPIYDPGNQGYNMPYDFCFYGNTYSKVYAGSNGALTFTQPTGSGLPPYFSPWSFNQTIPNTGFPIKNAIYGVYQDVDPSVVDEDDDPVGFAHPLISVVTYGQFPWRYTVISYSSFAQFGSACNNNPNVGGQTSMIVLYETTNVVEVYVERRVPCPSWNGGRGLIGVQNSAGTDAVAPPGRNTGPWQATNEAWRFTPNGDSIVTYEWLEAGNVIGNTQTITVCPDDTTTYTARVIYNRCDGSTVVRECETTVELMPPLGLGAPDDMIVCDPNGGPLYTFDLTENNDQILNGLDPFLNELYIFETFDDADENFNSVIDPANYQTDGTLQTIYVRVTDYFTGCYEIVTFDIQGSSSPAVTTPPDLYACDALNDGVEVFDLTVQEGIILAGQDPADFNFGYYTSFGNASTETSPITDPQNYQSGSQTIYVRVNNNINSDCYSIVDFDLIVTPQPVVDVLPDVEACDSYILPVLTQGNYYTQPAGQGTQLAAGTAITTDQTIYIYASQGTAPNNCTDESSFSVTVFPTPVVATPADVSVCDSYTLPALTTGNYYTGPGGTGTMLAANDAVTTTQTLYIYAQSGSGLCEDESSFTVTVNYAPTLVAATPLEACEDAYSNTGYFDLTEAGAEVTQNQPGYTITYHESLADAQAPGGNSPIATPDNYLSLVPQVYIRVIQAGSTTDCYSVEPVELIVHDRPAVPSVTPYVLCDDNNSPDGVEVFDLTIKDAQVTGGVAGTTATYYATQSDLNNDVAIANPQAYQNATPWSQQVWVKATSNFGCESTSSFTLTVNPLPVVNPDLDTFYACEEVPGQGEFDLTVLTLGVTGGAPGYTVAFYDNVTSAQNAGADYLTSPYLAPTGTIYALMEDAATGCSTITPVELEVLPAPIAPQPAPLQECDFNNDEVAIFNLNPVLQQIEAALGNVDVTAHETYNDAFYGGVNAIGNTGAYSNVNQFTIGGIQTLYLLVQSDQTECFDIVELQLIVNPVPVAVIPQDYELCDSGTNDTDGYSVFDLTTVNAEVLGSLDPTQYSVAYYESLTAAQLGTGAITTPAAYNSDTKTLFVRVTNTTTGCYDIVELELIVNPLPVANQPTPYTLCDEVTQGDEQEEFDLTTKIDEIISVGGVPQEGINVTFHHSYADAQSGDGAITNPEAYTNATTVETLFVRVTVEDTGCYRIVLLDVRVEPLPVLYPNLIDPELTTLCDMDGDGFAEFDLQAMVDDMVDNGVNLQVTFHETAADAVSGANPIANPSQYYNDVANIDFIYVHVVNTATGCSNPVAYTIPLTVISSPQVPDLTDLTQCDDQDNNGQDNRAYFDLTVQEAGIYAGEGIDSDFIVHYFISEAYANAGAPRITTPAHYYGTGEQTIWVRVEDPDTGCYGVSSFMLHLNQPVALTLPSILAICDNTEPINDSFAVFDLTTKDEEILGPFGVGMDNVVTYFETEEDRENNTDPITTPEAYTNTENAQTLYVLVTTPEGCRSYTTLTIKVNPLPTPNENPDALELCDDNNSPDGVEAFDLTAAAQDIRNNNNSVTLTYYETQEDADNAENPIADPTAYSSATGSVWVRVENAVGCYVSVELPLVVNPLPVLGDGTTIEPFAHCEQSTDGFDQFLLTEHIPVILGSQDPAEYTVRFFLTQANAQANSPALPNQYTNTTAAQQTIWVRVTNKATGCVAIGSFDLLVEEQAIANPVTTTFYECDTDGTNDGYYQWDLTVVEPEVLGSQDPAIHAITYYTSLEDAQDDVNAIGNPAAYVNQSANSEEIWVRIVNTSTISGCPDFTSFTLNVEQLPMPALTDGTVCIDYVTGDTLRAHTLDTGLDGATHTFVWTLDGTVLAETGASIDAQSEGTYSVVATSIAGGCVSEEVFATVALSGPPSVAGSGYTVSNAFSDDQVITVTVEGYGEYVYSLDDGPWQESNVFTNVIPGSHVVHVKDVSTDNPCDELEFILNIEGVSVIDYPNFFTPNGDGYHDTWNIIGLENQPNARIFIFDRYGKLIKQLSPTSTGPGEGWDGTFNGQQLPATDYWFTVTYQDQNGVTREFKSHFAMKR